MYEVSCRKKEKCRNLITLKRYLFSKIRALLHIHWNLFGENCETFWGCLSKVRCARGCFLHISTNLKKNFISNVSQWIFMWNHENYMKKFTKNRDPVFWNWNLVCSRESVRCECWLRETIMSTMFYRKQRKLNRPKGHNVSLW